MRDRQMIVDCVSRTGKYSVEITTDAYEQSFKHTGELWSPEFSCAGRKWKLKLEKDDQSDDSAKASLGVFLMPLEATKQEETNLTAKYDVSYKIIPAKESDGKEPMIKKYEALDPREKDRNWDDGWGICDIAEVGQVKSLTVEMVITVIEDRVIEKNSESSEKVDVDFFELLKKIPELSDASITCKDGTTIPVHRLILSTFSPIFRAMFSHKHFVENLEGTVEIEDFSPDIVKSFVSYLYSQKVPKTSNYEQLFLIADKYKVKSLGKHCLKALMKDINTKNACNLLVRMKHFDMLNESDLVRPVIEFLYRNLGDCKNSVDYNVIRGDAQLLGLILDQSVAGQKRNFAQANF